MSVELLLGDCLAILPDIQSNSINMVFLDLPYCGVNNSKKESAIYCEWNIPIDLQQLWSHLLRVTTYNAPLFFCCNAKFGAALIASAPELFRYEYIWKKSKAVGFLNSGYMRLTNHELIYVFYKNKPNYYVKDFHTKIANPKRTRPKEESDKGKSIYGVELGKDAQYKNTGLYEPPLPTSVIEIASKGNSHPTEKPVELVEFFLKYFTKEGDVVLDPTFGSCPTGEACKKMNRDFIGIELREDYYNVALARLGFN